MRDGPERAAETHIAITESLDGKNTDWTEPFTDEQYGL
jgi:hypothetical protein